MPSLVSPGVSVTVVDESFYIPAAAPTVPLFFVATQANKLQPNGVSPAEGTNEYGVIRTVTSIGQSVSLYGVPAFLKDSAGNAFHGDARNEYGLFALNQYLGIGSYAYVIRANVDLADAAIEFTTLGIPSAKSYSYVGVGGDQLVSLPLNDYSGLLTGPLGTGLPYAQSELIQPEQFTIVITQPATFASNGDLATEAEFTVTGDKSGILLVSIRIICFLLLKSISAFPVLLFIPYIVAAITGSVGCAFSITNRAFKSETLSGLERLITRFR